MSNPIQEDEELREKLSKFSTSGAHACYCERSTDRGCTCALKDEYVDELIRFVKAHSEQKALEASKKAINKAAEVLTYHFYPYGREEKDPEAEDAIRVVEDLLDE